MIRNKKSRKFFACFLLTIYSIEFLAPLQALALTSGPSQPEFSSFQSADVSSMVNLFTGDMGYNLPLMEVDGYPLNLSYSSGISIEDEASWVGLGWNLNVGTINRQMRGIPDDMHGSGDGVVNGDDWKVTRTAKPKVTVGYNVIAKVEVLGFPFNLGANGSASFGLFSDSYTGIGAEISSNAGLSMNTRKAGKFTAGMGLSSNTSSGLNTYFSLAHTFSVAEKDNSSTQLSLSAAIGHNTRSGFKDINLNSSIRKYDKTTFTDIQTKETNSAFSNGRGMSLAGRSISFNDVVMNSGTGMKTKTFSASASFDGGPSGLGAYWGAGFSGYYIKQEYDDTERSLPQFGFLYADKGQHVPDAVHDFQSEKESLFIPEIPTLPVTTPQPDLFSFTNQLAGGQFRLHRSGSGIFFNTGNHDENESASIGADVGFGDGFHVGGSLYYQTGSNGNRKWADNNQALERISFKKGQYYNDEVFFKVNGEFSAEDKNYLSLLQYDHPVSVKARGEVATAEWDVTGANGTTRNITMSTVQRSGKAARNTMVSFLTAEQAAILGLDKKIRSYPFNNYSENGFTPASGHQLSANAVIDRYASNNNGYRKKHHISEFTVLTNEGARHVYGIPVYNITQEDYTYAIGSETEYQSNADLGKNILKLGPGGIQVSSSELSDRYYNKEILPGYATSYLLSGILSPDYVDLTGDGITDDDNGTAIKFNYSKVDAAYKWRTPYPLNDTATANISRGSLADRYDDKAMISYGEKELWYIHSIETKNYIAYFVTENRTDGYGVTSLTGGVDDSNARLKRLREIRLYNKVDTATPVKVVRFEYSYDLVKGTPNADSGKLTLKKVYFYYQNNFKGQYFPYEFEYNNENSDEIDYDYLSNDRWGTYKPKNINATIGIDLKNDEYPYTIQDSSLTNRYAQAWLLKKIKLPSGGTIQVEYESDDYAWVQDKRAAIMAKIDGFITDINASGTTNDLWQTNGVIVDIGADPEDYGYSSGFTDFQALEWFKRYVLAGTDQMLCRMYVDLSGLTNRSLSVEDRLPDIVSCYATVEAVRKSSGNKFKVIFKKVSEHKDDPVNPILQTALQKMQMELPQHSFPGYNSRVQNGDNSRFEQAIRAFTNAAINISELLESFQTRARRMRFAEYADVSKSFVRIVQMKGRKLGGGVRVKKVWVNDAWKELSDDAGSASTSNGVYYEYTRTDEFGNTVSSGVASYEPYIGGEENILKQPVKYIQNIHGAKNNLFYFEEPFGEMLFPSPQVGYSKVSVYSLNAAGEKDAYLETGWQEHEFFTANDFPTLHSYQPMQKEKIGGNEGEFLIYSRLVDKRVYSQGFLIELNDMHGKLRKVSNFNSAGALISSEENIYKTGKNYQGKPVPGNEAPVIDESGTLHQNSIVGKEVEVFTQMNEVYTNSVGHTLFGGSDVSLLFIIPHFYGNRNEEYRRMNYSSTTKMIYRYGIIDKVIKTINGSVSEARNLAYDAYSGQPMVVESTNEFEQPVYSTTLPAYWMHKGMGGAYKTAGSYLKGIVTGFNGIIKNQVYYDFLQEGDELLTDEYEGKRLWVIKTENQEGVSEKRIIDEWGNVFAWKNGFSATVIRSGNRNQLNAAAASFVTLENPLTASGDLIDLVAEGSVAWLKVISASAMEYDQERVGIPDCQCPTGYYITNDKKNCIKYPYVNPGGNFTFVSGYIMTGGTVGGADIYQTFNSGSPVNKKSRFWGGDCELPQMMMRSFEDPCPPNEECDSTENPAPCDQYPDLCPNPDPCIVNPASCGGDTTGTGGPYHNYCAGRINFPNSTDCGRFWTHSIWLCEGPTADPQEPKDEWIGFEICIDVPATKTYYMAYAVDDNMIVYHNSFEILNQQGDTYNKIHVKPVDLPEGPNSIAVMMENNQDSHAGVLLEIYDMTYSDLINSDSVPENKIIFSTGRDVKNNPKAQVYRQMWTSNQYTKYYHHDTTYPTIPKLGDICIEPLADYIPNTFNPYVNGQLAAWYPKKEYAYLTDRSYANITNTDSVFLNLGRTGFLEAIESFWSYNRQKNTWQKNAYNDARWVYANNTTLVDRLGNVLEQHDALNRYTSAIYGFNDKLPVATASLAQQKEILYESFEDKIGDALGTLQNCVEFPTFRHNQSGSITALINTDYSHSGYASLLLTSGTLTYTTRFNSHRPEDDPYKQLRVNQRAEYQMYHDTSYFIRGFEPLPEKAYLFQAWIRKDAGYATTEDLTVQVNSTTLTLAKKALVEDWLLVEAAFSTATGEDELLVSLSGSNVYIDDIRIFPKSAMMKSFVYNYINHQLMATIDETGFSTFYEYDDEGSLIRVKRETSKGVVTVQESRRSNKKNTP